MDLLVSEFSDFVLQDKKEIVHRSLLPFRGFPLCSTYCIMTFNMSGGSSGSGIAVTGNALRRKLIIEAVLCKSQCDVVLVQESPWITKSVVSQVHHTLNGRNFTCVGTKEAAVLYDAALFACSATVDRAFLQTYYLTNMKIEDTECFAALDSISDIGNMVAARHDLGLAEPNQMRLRLLANAYAVLDRMHCVMTMVIVWYTHRITGNTRAPVR